jgi:superfamily II DNA/RNA helicase
MVSLMCQTRGMKHVCIHGQTAQVDRQRALKQFAEDASTSVLSMTFGTGALG